MKWCRRSRGLAALAASIALGIASGAQAAPDEIQVYIDELLAPGEKGVELHMNYVPGGRRTPDYPGEVPPGGVFRFTPEISWGLVAGWDMGIYIPFSDSAYQGGVRLDGTKLRVKRLVNPDADGLFYGVNVELAYSSYRVSPTHWDTEIRTIVGWRSGRWLVAANPILAVPIGSSRAGDSSAELELDIKVGYEVVPRFAIGFEQYSEFGPVNDLTFGSASGETTFAVLDYEGKGWGLNFGVGRGWTEPVDKWVVKAILGFDF